MTINDLLTQYNALKRQARDLRDELGRPSRDEALLYSEAAKLCDRIASYYGDQEHARNRWLMFKKENNDLMIQTANAIGIYANAPQPQPAPRQQPERPAFSTGSLMNAAMRKTELDGYTKPADNYVSYAANRQGQNGNSVTPSTDPGDPRPITTTASGFCTKNATEHVSAETIERWFIKERPDIDFYDIVGNDDLKKKMLGIIQKIKLQKSTKKVGLKPFSGFLLYGPPGTGKTEIVTAFAAEMMDRGFQFMSIDCATIHESLVGKSEKLVEAAFLEAIDKAPCVLFLDEFESLAVSRSKAKSYEKRLTIALIEEYNKLVRAGKPIVLLVATNHPEELDTAWMDRMRYKELLPLPSEEMRAEYFRKKTEGFVLTDGLTVSFMVNNTDNTSFRDLDMYITFILETLLENLATEYSVENDGVVDYDAIDDMICKTLDSGKTEISRELFIEALKSCHKSPKIEIIRSLEEFTESLDEQSGIDEEDDAIILDDD